MVDLNKFVYMDNWINIEDTEYQKVLASEDFFIQVNGGDEAAMNLRIKQLETDKEMLLTRIQSGMLAITLREKALSELADKLK